MLGNRKGYMLWQPIRKAEMQEKETRETEDIRPRNAAREKTGTTMMSISWAGRSRKKSKRQSVRESWFWYSLWNFYWFWCFAPAPLCWVSLEGCRIWALTPVTSAQMRIWMRTRQSFWRAIRISPSLVSVPERPEALARVNWATPLSSPASTMRPRKCVWYPSTVTRIWTGQTTPMENATPLIPRAVRSRPWRCWIPIWIWILSITWA